METTTLSANQSTDSETTTNTYHFNMIEMNYNILLLSGSDVGVYNCGEMSSEEPDLETHSICGEGKSQVIYAWAMDAPSLELPDGVGFRVGGDSGINYLVLQVSQNMFFLFTNSPIQMFTKK